VRELDTAAKGVDGIESRAATREAEGAIDVLRSTTRGVGGATPLELTRSPSTAAMFRGQLLGSIRMIRAVLPAMRERRAGASST